MSRLDAELVRRQLVRSRSQARELIDAGRVQVNDRVVTRAAAPVAPADHVHTDADHYVSRAAHKLLGALADLRMDVHGRALDAGASAGGFTQVLLERGCDQVYAVDVGTGQLAAGVRSDPRVVVWEQTNLRDLEVRHVADRPVDLVVADVSFISLVLLVERLGSVVAADGRMLLMVKPQFEVGRELLGKGGVVRSPALHRQAVLNVAEAAAEHGWFATQVVPSRVPGPAGNVEYFVLFSPTQPERAPDLAQAVASVPG